MGKFDDDGLGPVEDDPYADLFADCSTPEEVLALQCEIEKARVSHPGAASESGSTDCVAPVP
jgi:hypothetical protein